MTSICNPFCRTAIVTFGVKDSLRDCSTRDLGDAPSPPPDRLKTLVVPLGAHCLGNPESAEVRSETDGERGLAEGPPDPRSGRASSFDLLGSVAARDPGPETGVGPGSGERGAGRTGPKMHCDQHWATTLVMLLDGTGLAEYSDHSPKQLPFLLVPADDAACE